MCRTTHNQHFSSQGVHILIGWCEKCQSAHSVAAKDGEAVIFGELPKSVIELVRMVEDGFYLRREVLSCS